MQIQLFKDYAPAQIQTYIVQIQAAKAASNGLFNATAAQSYATAIQGLEAKQAALLLSTQGLTNAQIAETLAVNESNVAKNYQVMADAGLLKRKQTLTAAQVQENLQTVLGADADTSAAMASFGLSAAIEGQENQTVQLTAKKLQEAVTTGALTEAQAQEMAMRAGVMASMNVQTATTLPQWIATLKAATIAIWDQVKATAVWLAATPARRLFSTIAAVGIAVHFAKKAYDALTISAEEANEAMDEAVSDYESAKSRLESINTELEEQNQKIDELLTKDKLTYAEKGQLEELQAITKELLLQQDIEEKNAQKASREAADKTVVAYNKQYGDYDISKDAVEEHLKFAVGSDIVNIDDNNISANLALLSKYNEMLAETEEKLTDKDNLSEDEIEWLEDDYQDYIDNINIISDSVDTALSDLQEKSLALEDEYNRAIEKRQNGEPLTTSEQEAISTYESIYDAIKLIYEYTDQNEWNDMEISNIFNTEGIEKTRDELIAMAKAGELTPEMIAGYKRLNAAIQDSALFLKNNQTAAEAFCDEIYADAEAVKDAANIDVTSAWSGFTEEQSQAITDFQSKVKTLGDALSSVRSGEDIDFTDLLKEFPELQGKSKNLEQAITELINTSWADLQKAMGDGLPGDAKNDLQDFVNGSTGAAPNLEDAFSAIQKSHDTLQDFKKAMSEGMTDEALSSVGSLSTKLNDMVAAYHAGTITIDQLYAALTDHYNTDLQNYGNAMIAKNQYNEAFYTALGLNSAEVVNQFKENYKIDIDNCKTYNAAKLAIEKQTLTNLSKAWSKYYQVQYDEKSEDPAMLALKESAAHGDAMAQAQLAYIQQEKDRCQTAIDALNSIVYEGIDANFTDISTNLASNPSSSKETEQTAETFNFLETLINRLTSALDRLKTAGENTFKSLAVRTGAYDSALSVVSKQLETQQQAYDIYMAKANAVGLDEYWASQVRDGSINIADITDEGLKQKIKDYQTWYEKCLDCRDAIEDLEQQQTQLLQAKIELQITHYDNLLEKLSGANDRIQNKIGLKESWGFTAGISDYSDMNKNLRKQIDNTAKQNEELKKLLATVDESSEAWYEYNQRIDSNNASMQDLKKTMAENAKAAAALAGETASNKVEKYQAKSDLYDAISDNEVTAKNKNKQIGKQIKNLDKQQTAYDNAVKTDKKNLKSAQRTIKDYKSDAKNSSVLKEIQKYTKSGKRIPKSVLEKAAKLDDNAKLYDACVRYNAFLDSYNEDKAAADLFRQTSRQKKADLALEQFNNIAAEYDNKISRKEQKKTKINNRIALAEAQGKKASASDYKSLISAETAEQNKNIKKREALQKKLDKAVADGTITKGSDKWYTMVEDINAVTNAIDESAQALAEYGNAMRQLDWDAFDDAMETSKRTNSEADYYISLMSNEDMVDKEGNFTEYGKATLALHHANYDSYMAQADAYAKEYQELMDKIARGEESLEDENVINRLRELQDASQDCRLAAEEENQARIEMIKQGYEAQLNSLNDLIGKYKDLKQSEKDAYDYQKSIAEKTKNIAFLQKQLAAYGSNDTEEARAKIQELKVSLEEAKQDLKETEYEKYLSDTNNMLDELYADYESFLDEKLNDTNELLNIINETIGGEDGVIGTLNSLNAGISGDGGISDTLQKLLSGKMNPNGTGADTENSEKSEAEPKASEDAVLRKSADTTNKHAEYQKEPALNLSLEPDLQMLANTASRSAVEKATALYDKQKQAITNQAAQKAQKTIAQVQKVQENLLNRESLIPIDSSDNKLTTALKEYQQQITQLQTAVPPSVVPDLSSAPANRTIGNVSIDIGDILLPDVQNPEQFSKKLVQTIADSSTVQRTIQAVSVDLLAKQNSFSAKHLKYN